jgi:hypothetical protein
MLAIGPMFPEESDYVRHRPVRDEVAALEKGLASALRARGYEVLGRHSSAIEPNQTQVDEVLRLVEGRLKAMPTH